MATSTRKYPITSNTFDRNVADILNTEPYIIYTGSLDNSGEEQVEDTFMIPAGYGLDSVVTYNNSGATTNTVDKIGVGTTTATGVDGVAAVVISEDNYKSLTVAANLVYKDDRLGYIHTMDGSSATYDIVCTYTIVLKKLVY